MDSLETMALNLLSQLSMTLSSVQPGGAEPKKGKCSAIVLELANRKKTKSDGCVLYFHTNSIYR